ncbi:SagB/ThcOx family dehydrogenase [Kutzneria kofuensis]|uniref:SagB-type dehydrogenase family enzyme n=1 Tax=Kutzneria kofuensis TaxID=103725 RepID=A0A7W9KLY3_9PSEU|nr:SagB/ThcOx family dehydrogenase [Kutzneria kofuensis]MBB5895007.1 SagB-type dehydrogenase family enzyme [Kutzneria kofuensis]
MRLRISACGGVFAVDGQVVWDDYLDHRQVVLGTDTDEVLRWFIRWRDRDSVPERHRAVVEALLANDVLVAEGSQRDAQEQAVLHAWGSWGPVARAYHYSTRTTRGTRFPTPDEPTEPLSAFPDTERIPLPSAEQAQWQHRDLLDVLHLRRDHREFGGGPVPLTALGALLQVSAVNSTELYPAIRDVEGVKPGVYHYDSRRHELALVGDAVSDAELVAACGDQPWVTGAGLAVFYTSVVRDQDSPRAYRMLQLDAGHTNQTLSLAATALGLRTTFTAAIRDELVEELIGCDPATELAIGCAIVGTA